MAWIELHQEIWTHRKTLILAFELDLEEMYAASHIIHLWTWALDNVPDGDLSGLPNRVIAYGAGWRKDPDVFINAAVKAGWFDVTEAGLHIHDWYEYAGRLIEKRKEDAERKRNSRRQSKDVQRMSSGQDTDSPQDVQRMSSVTVPNRTLNNNNNNNNAREDIFSAFEKEFGRLLSPMEIEQIKQWECEHSQPLILEALKRAALGGKHNFKYINSILMEWKKNNIRTIQEVEQYDDDFKARKSTPRIRGAPTATQMDKLDEWAKGAD
jgi:DnaD/phage-associated family protein